MKNNLSRQLKATDSIDQAHLNGDPLGIGARVRAYLQDVSDVVTHSGRGFQAGVLLLGVLAGAKGTVADPVKKSPAMVKPTKTAPAQKPALPTAATKAAIKTDVKAVEKDIAVDLNQFTTPITLKPASELTRSFPDLGPADLKGYSSPAGQALRAVNKDLVLSLPFAADLVDVKIPGQPVASQDKFPRTGVEGILGENPPVDPDSVYREGTMIAYYDFEKEAVRSDLVETYKDGPIPSRREMQQVTFPLPQPIEQMNEWRSMTVRCNKPDAKFTLRREGVNGDLYIALDISDINELVSLKVGFYGSIRAQFYNPEAFKKEIQESANPLQPISLSNPFDSKTYRQDVWLSGDKYTKNQVYQQMILGSNVGPGGNNVPTALANPSQKIAGILYSIQKIVRPTTAAVKSQDPVDIFATGKGNCLELTIAGAPSFEVNNFSALSFGGLNNQSGNLHRTFAVVRPGITPRLLRIDLGIGNPDGDPIRVLENTIYGGFTPFGVSADQKYQVKERTRVVDGLPQGEFFVISIDRGSESTQGSGLNICPGSATYFDMGYQTEKIRQY